MCLPSHCQGGAPMINIHSTIRTAPFVIMFHSQRYLIATAMHVQFYAVRCVYVYTYCSQYRDTGRAKVIKNGTEVNATCQGNVSACHFGNACRRFGRPGIEVLRILNSFFMILLIVYVFSIIQNVGTYAYFGVFVFHY
jgi:hypothetical protein